MFWHVWSLPGARRCAWPALLVRLSRLRVAPPLPPRQREDEESVARRISTHDRHCWALEGFSVLGQRPVMFP